MSTPLMDTNYIQFEGDKCIITIREVLKHAKVGEHQTPLELQAYLNDKRICVVEYLKEHLKRTANLRNDETQ